MLIEGRPRRKVGVYNLYWSTYGGGEQVAGAIAEVLAARDSDAVDVLGPEPVDVARMRTRLGVDLSRCGYRRITDDAEASAASRDYDVFVTTTYLSKAINHAPIGLYYAHFPEEGRSRRDARRAATAARVLPLLERAGGRLGRRGEALRATYAERIVDRSFLASYAHVIANSAFTAGWIERLWGVPATVLHPPVRMLDALPKRPLIASVGRFFSPAFGHCKKQLDLVVAFRDLYRRGRADGWELHLVGGADAKNRDYVNDVRRAAVGLPVEIHLNAPGDVVREILGEAAMFWHGGGYGEDLELHPERAEHFGIAVVEAMSAGAVPVVFGAAGPAEIVRDRVDGFHWHTPDELVEHSAALIADPARRAALAESASRRARDFDLTVFAAELGELASAAPVR